MFEDALILHLSDLQFGENNRFGINRYENDDSYIHLYDKLVEDIELITRQAGKNIDLIIHSGDLAERSLPDEYGHSLSFFSKLAAAINIDRNKIVIVPGNHDINWTLIQHERQKAEMEKRTYVAPYIEKFYYLNNFYKDFYGDYNLNNQLYKIFKYDDLKLLIIALTSCYSECDLDGTHTGDFGPTQLNDAFLCAKELDQNRDYLWIVVLHHGLETTALAPEEALAHPDELISICRDYGVEIILHGHQHIAKTYIKGDTGFPVYIFSSGSAGLDTKSLPDVLNHYSILSINRFDYTRYHRQYSTQVINATRGLGKWTPDASNFDNGIESEKFYFDLFELPKKKSLQTNPIEYIKYACQKHNEKEIREQVGRKYIPNLYVHREFESNLGEALYNDDQLTDKLIDIREDTFNYIFKVLEECEKQYQSKAVIEKQDKASVYLTQTGETIDDILAGGRPRDGIKRDLFTKLIDQLRQLVAVAADIQSPTKIYNYASSSFPVELV